MMQLISMMRGGGNPMQMLMGMSPQNPIIGQVMQMVNGRTPMEIQQMVSQIANQRGVNLGQMAQSLGLRLPL